jgi:hypothetical protein
MTEEVLAEIPHQIICDGISVSDLKNGRLNQTRTSVTLDIPTSSEEIFGFLVEVADLQALKRGDKAEISAQTYKGYWWADGDHVDFVGEAICKIDEI